MQSLATVLLLGEGQDLHRIRTELDQSERFGVELTPSLNDALALLRRFAFDVVIVGEIRPRRISEAIIRLSQCSPEISLLILRQREAQWTLIERLLLEVGAARCISPGAAGPDLRREISSACA